MVNVTHEKWDALRAYIRATGAFVAHFDDRELPPVLNEKRWEVWYAGETLIRALDADQQ